MPTPTITASTGRNDFDDTTADYSGADEAVRLNMFHQPTSGDDEDDSLWAEDDTFATSVTVIRLSSHSDFFVGDGRDITVYSGDSDDYIYGAAYNEDWLFGEAGDDTFLGGGGIDHMSGGDGRDVVAYNDAPTGITASLRPNILFTGWAAGDVYDSIEDLQGSAHDDILWSVEDGGEHQLVGDPGIGDGNGGNDILYGGGDFTNFIPGAGHDILFGGTGENGTSRISHNQIDYETAGSAVTINLASPWLNTGEAAGDIYINLQYVVTYISGPGINHLDGSLFDVDTGGHNTGLVGSMWNDVIWGDDGVNDIWGDPVAPLLYLDGPAGPIFVYSVGDDELHGGGGSDLLRGGRGADVLYGDSGIDGFAYFSDTDSTASQTDVIKDFQTGEAIEFFYDPDHPVSGLTITRTSAGSTITSAGGLKILVEGDAVQASNLWDGANPNMSIGIAMLGSAANDILRGASRADAIYGGDGADTIEGGGGADTLAGNAGADIFVYSSASDSTSTSTDAILDFGTGVDRISLGAGLGGSVALVRSGGGTVLFSGSLQIGIATEVNGGDLLGLTAGVQMVGTGAGENLIGSSYGDFIIGGGGADYMNGGAGNDTFWFSAVADSSVSASDTVGGFVHGADIIDLTSVWTGSSDTIGIGRFGGNSYIFVDIGGGGNDMRIEVLGEDIQLSDIRFAPSSSALELVSSKSVEPAVFTDGPDIDLRTGNVMADADGVPQFLRSHDWYF